MRTRKENINIAVVVIAMALIASIVIVVMITGDGDKPATVQYPTTTTKTAPDADFPPSVGYSPHPTSIPTLPAKRTEEGVLVRPSQMRKGEAN